MQSSKRQIATEMKCSPMNRYCQSGTAFCLGSYNHIRWNL